MARRLTAVRIMLCVTAFFFLASVAGADTLVLGAGAGCAG